MVENNRIDSKAEYSEIIYGGTFTVKIRGVGETRITTQSYLINFIKLAYSELRGKAIECSLNDWEIIEFSRGSHACVLEVKWVGEGEI